MPEFLLILWSFCGKRVSKFWHQQNTREVICQFLSLFEYNFIVAFI